VLVYCGVAPNPGAGGVAGGFGLGESLDRGAPPEDIDAFVRVVRFDGWQQSSAGEREVQSELRKVLLLKYKLRDQALFDKAYAYIKEYY
jgi:hypothetical protein